MTPTSSGFPPTSPDYSVSGLYTCIWTLDVHACFLSCHFPFLLMDYSLALDFLCSGYPEKYIIIVSLIFYCLAFYFDPLGLHFLIVRYYLFLAYCPEILDLWINLLLRVLIVISAIVTSVVFKPLYSVASSLVRISTKSPI